jgi:hypothetical protein
MTVRVEVAVKPALSVKAQSMVSVAALVVLDEKIDADQPSLTRKLLFICQYN